MVITHKGTDFYLDGINYSILEFYNMGLITQLISYIEREVGYYRELAWSLDLIKDSERMLELSAILNA